MIMKPELNGLAGAKVRLTILCGCCRYAAGDYAGQILQQCLDMIRYQPPATNLTVPTSAGYGENVTSGVITAGEREHDLWRRGLQVIYYNFCWMICEDFFNKKVVATFQYYMI